jgi:hypothetical protein
MDAVYHRAGYRTIVNLATRASSWLISGETRVDL